MGIWVKILTGSNSAAGLTFFFLMAGLAFAPVAGVLVDRFRRRPLAAGANLLGAVVVCLLLLVHGKGDVWLIYAVMFGYGVLAALLTSAQTAMVPALVPDELLGEANALLQMGSQGMRIFTPLIGAGLLAWVGPAPVILLDAATFAIASGCMLALSLRESRPARTQSSWRAELTAGLRYTWHTTVLRKMLVTAVLALAVIGFMETISFAIVTGGLHKKAAFLGVLVAVQAAGAIAGALVAAPVMKRLGEVAIIAVGLLLIGAGCLLMTMGMLALVTAGEAVLGLAVIWINVAAITLIQRRTPTELMGRVDAALTLASTGPQAISVAVGAALITAVSYRLLLVAVAVMMVIACAYWLVGQDRAAAGAEQQDLAARAAVPIVRAEAAE
jgi:MFS family permease